jgi:hypothetical protein
MSKRFFHNALDRLIAARERQVRRYVNGALLQLDDETLESLGRSREQLNREGVQAYYF